MAPVKCPFCGEDDFDLVGLKAHLLRGGCEPFDACVSPEADMAREKELA